MNKKVEELIDSITNVPTQYTDDYQAGIYKGREDGATEMGKLLMEPVCVRCGVSHATSPSPPIPTNWNYTKWNWYYCPVSGDMRQEVTRAEHLYRTETT